MTKVILEAIRKCATAGEKNFAPDVVLALLDELEIYREAIEQSTLAADGLQEKLRHLFEALLLPSRLRYVNCDREEG